MKRVEADEMWSLFDPKVVPHFPILYGERSRRPMWRRRSEKLFARQMKARELYARMMKMLAETGNGWMTFKDACNLKSNQTALPQNVVHLSNLCTEITEVTLEAGDGGLQSWVDQSGEARERGCDSISRSWRQTVRTAVKFLDRVIDINFYPIGQAADFESRSGGRLGSG